MPTGEELLRHAVRLGPAENFLMVDSVVSVCVWGGQ